MKQIGIDTAGKSHTDVIQEVIKNPAKHGITMCSLHPFRRCVGVGCFLPYADFGKRIGQPANKQRVVFYGLCSHCADEMEDEESKKRISQAIEDWILSSMEVQ